MNEIDFLYDKINEAILLRMPTLANNYILGLLRVVADVTDSLEDVQIDAVTLSKLEAIYQDVKMRKYHHNTLKTVFGLLLVRGYKHQQKALDVFVPNTIGYLVGHILQVYFSEVEDVRLLNINAKTGNFILDVMSIFDRDDLEAIAIENDQEFVKIAKAYFDFTTTEVLIYFQDPLQEFHDVFDVIVGELQPQEYTNYKYYSKLYANKVTHLPFLMIEKYQEKLKEDGLMVLLVNQDFFFHQDFAKLKEESQGLAFLSFIILPETMFQEQATKKGILLLKKTTKEYPQMSLIQLPSLTDQTQLQEIIKELDIWLKEHSLRRKK